MTNPGVCPFSPSDFYSALANPHAPREEVERHSHAKYLFGYLSDLRAESIVIEDPYTDADFLDDYTAHYARCFADYKRRCKRVHFFRRTFTDSEVRALLRRCLSKEEQQALQRDYLGFVVARPLPRTIVGRTILRTLDDEARRRFPATRTYRANFFGVELKVEGLAFQEQDSVLAACATVALWSRRLSGFELHTEFVRAAKARLVLMARSRGFFTEVLPADYLSKIFPKIVV